MKYTVRPLRASVPSETVPHRPIAAEGLTLHGEPSQYWVRLALAGDVAIDPVEEPQETQPTPRRAPK